MAGQIRAHLGAVKAFELRLVDSASTSSISHLQVSNSLFSPPAFLQETLGEDIP